MGEQENENAKYHVEINKAYGPVTGDYAHVEQHFHVEQPLPLPISRDELLIAIRQAGAELRTYPNEVACIHIDRVEVDEIVEWALNAEPKQRLGMVLDQAGGGKTVVMRDVLERLEDTVPVLAIKADWLSGVKTSGDLAERLGLPATVEECARSLATEGLFVVLLDQLDALSLALSRDQATLDVMLTTLARLRDLEGMRIVASCRTFDLNHDLRLSTVQVDRKFRLQPLTEEQVNGVLRALGVDPTRLLPGHRELLTVPLHLEVYARVVVGDALVQLPESFRTLQELYEALWRKRIEVVLPDTPAPKERVTAVYRLVDAMQSRRQLAAPEAVLDECPEAAKYLERVGFIRREGSNWLFFHQTLFDYCYARRFVAQGRSLSQEILGGPQGLFERSQMVQVLAYLRGADEKAYRRELTDLLFADGLRVHLRLLLIGWFGSLPNPTADELRIARRLIQDADGQVRFLRAAGGSEDWFDLLNDDVLPTLLRTDDDRLFDVLIRYLGTLIQRRTDAVLAHLRPHLGASEAWDARIAFCLSQLEDWQSDEALDMLCDLLSRGRATNWERFCLHNIAKSSNLATGCRALRAYLDHCLDDLLAQEQAERQDAEADPTAAYRTDLPSRFGWDHELLGDYAIDEIMKGAAQVCPQAVIEHLLLWFVRAAMTLTEPAGSDEDYPSDSLFSWGWVGASVSKAAVFALRMVEALQNLAKTEPVSFRALAAQLANVESLAIQRVLARAFLAGAKTYASDIFDYLTADKRRLNLGDLEDSHYDSYRLYRAVFRHLDAERRAVLEQLILDLQPKWERRGLGRRGITQLHFLKSVDLPDLLSEKAQRRLQELEHKFPGFELQPPRGIEVGAVGSPIEDSAQSKMSDEAWLGAMRKYDDSTAWGAPREEVLKGGVIELSRAFTEQVKKDPKRFYRLAQRFDETISLYYVGAAISGLAGSDAPAEWLFDLVRQFAPRIEGETRRGVCWALEKRAEAGVPDDLLDLIADWALHDPNPAKELWRIPASSGEPYYGGDPHSHGINSNRGAAVLVVCRCAMSRKPPQVERTFQLLEQAADDPSTAVRTCVVERLGPMLNEDDVCTLAIFERTLEGHPKLLQSPLVHRFLYWTYREHFPQTRPIIEALLSDEDDATRQAGARLVCLAAFQYPEVDEFAGRVTRGDVAMRRGAAQVYARNLEIQDVESVCQERLLRLMHDSDEQVRDHMDECFQYLRPEHLNRLQPFIEQFLTSPALMNGARHLVEYLAPLAPDAPDLALMATERILDVAGSEVTDIRTAAAMMERDLVRLPLTVYTHSFGPDEKSRAMGLFERMLELGSRAAQQALSDWDRR